MEVLAFLLVAVLFASGLYLMLQKSLLRVILGVSLLAHGVNLMLFQSGGFRKSKPPIVDGTPVSQLTDPLPQALILTAIVIGFATTAFLLVLAYRMYQEWQSDDLDKLRGSQDDE